MNKAVTFRALARYTFRLLGRMNGKLQSRSFFFIKAGYHHALRVAAGPRVTDHDQAAAVFEVAEKLAGSVGAGIIIIAPESMNKLPLWMNERQILEIVYASGDVVTAGPGGNREVRSFDQVSPDTLQARLVLVYGIIERFDNPDDLFDFVDEIAFDYLVVGAAERDREAGPRDYGPPASPQRYREWNSVELKNYLRLWFRMEDHRIFEGKSINQVIICKKNKRL